MSASGIVSMNAMVRGPSKRVVTDLVVVAVVGVVARRAMRAEFAPVDRAVARRMVLVDRRRDRSVIGGVSRIEEERCAETLRLGVCKATMQRGAIAIVRPDLCDIAEVDNERIGAWLDEFPCTIVQNFETGLPILQQQRQCPGVGVMIDTQEAPAGDGNILGAYRRRTLRIVVEPQEARVIRTEE